MNQRQTLLVPVAVALALTSCQLCDTGDRDRLKRTPTAALPAPARPGVVPITPANATIEFTGSTALKSQSGHFAAFDGTLEMPTDDPRLAKVRVVVDMNSTTTAIGLLTKHLKAEDFFDVARYPRAEFVSEQITPAAEPGQYRVSGVLTFHGVQKAVEFPARFSVTPDEVTFDGTFTVLQTEFGMAESARKTKDEVPVRVSLRGRRK